MDANRMNTHFFHLIKYDLEDHRRSHKVTFMFKTGFLLNIFLSKIRSYHLIKTLHE